MPSISIERRNMSRMKQRLAKAQTFVMLVFLAFPSFANAGHHSDSLLIRAILDSNGMTDRTVESVADYDGDINRFNRLRISGPLQLSKPFHLPAEIGGLDGLQELNLIDMGMDSLPAQMANLTRLLYVNLHGNAFTEFPGFILQCHELKELDLSSNKIPSLPDSFIPSQFPKLTILDLSANKIPSLPDAFYFPSLKISRNPITALPASVFNGPRPVLLEAIGCELTSLPEGKMEYANRISLDFSGNKLCHLPLSVSRWINTFTKSQKWTENQRCPAGEEPAPGIFSVSHGYNERVNSGAPLRVRLSRDMGDSIPALAEWNGNRFPFMLVALDHLPDPEGKVYAGDLSKAEIPYGAANVDISSFFSNGDTSSCRAKFYLIATQTFKIGPTPRYTIGDRDFHLSAAATDKYGNPLEITVFLSNFDVSGNRVRKIDVYSMSPFEMSLDWAEYRGYSVLIEYVVKDENQNWITLSQTTSSYAYKPPDPTESMAADFAPMQIGNQWVYEGTEANDYYPEGSSYLTKIRVTDTLVRGDTLFYSMEISDSVYGIRVAGKNQSHEWEAVPKPDRVSRWNDTAFERAGEVSYFGGQPDIFNRVLFNHWHIFEKSRLERRGVGSDAVYILNETKTTPQGSVPYLSRSFLQGVGTTEYWIKSSVARQPWNDRYEISYSMNTGHLVSFTAGPASLGGKGFPGGKASASRIPKAVFKNRKIQFLTDGKAYNGKGQR